MRDGLETGSDLNAELSGRGLRKEAAVLAERAGAVVRHVRINAVAIIPPHQVERRHRDARPSDLEHAAEAFGNLIRCRELANADVVALVEVVDDAGVLRDRVSLERALAIGSEVLQVFVGTALADAILTIAVAQNRQPKPTWIRCPTSESSSKIFISRTEVERAKAQLRWWVR